MLVMRRYIVAIVVFLALALGARVEAQYNRNYIYWMGQQKMVNNNYHEAIEILNVLLRHDAKDFNPVFNNN